VSQLLSNAVRNSTWTGLGSLGSAVLGFVFAGMTIRWLGAAEAGFVIAVATIAGINAGLSELGMGTAATRIIARAYAEQDSETVRKVGGVCCMVSGAFGVLGFALFAGGAPVIIRWAKYDGSHTVAMIYCVLAGIVFFLTQLSSLYTALLTSAQRFDWTTKFTLGLNLAQGLCGITFLKFFPSVLTVGITYAVLAVIGTVLRGLAVRKVFAIFPWPRWDRAIFRELWEFGRWIYLAQITTRMSDGLDKVILVSLFGSATLPFYSFAQRIYMMVHVTLVGQATYLFPMLSAQGANLAAVAERTEERVRWFIAVIAGMVFSGLIIAGPALLTLVVSPAFSAQASFQLLVFSFVGYIHAQSIVPYFYNLSKGDAKGNSIYQTITGFGILPALWACAYFLGQKHAVFGQLMVFGGVFYLARRGYSGNSASGVIGWFFKPLYSSIAMMLAATAIHVALAAASAHLLMNIAVTVLFFLFVALTLARIERSLLDGESRVETLGRGLSILFRKLGLSTDLVFQILAIPKLTPPANAAPTANP
jgi:O-antigen/teichoic acid export membrane protein